MGILLTDMSEEMSRDLELSHAGQMARSPERDMWLSLRK